MAPSITQRIQSLETLIGRYHEKMEKCLELCKQSFVEIEELRASRDKYGPHAAKGIEMLSWMQEDIVNKGEERDKNDRQRDERIQKLEDFIEQAPHTSEHNNTEERELKEQIRSLEAKFFKFDSQLEDLKGVLSTTKPNHDVTTSAALINQNRYEPQHINDVCTELQLRQNKKKNLIIFQMQNLFS